MHVSACESLAVALDIGRGALVAIVGGGGKTTALQLLARELSSAGARVVATTTTAMFLLELSEVGPVVLRADCSTLVAAVQDSTVTRGPLGVAYGLRDKGKVVGLPAQCVDELWTSGLSDYLIVEADGSRGRPLKAFGPYEPCVPSTTTMILHVAGLDALGVPLEEECVHRAALLARAMGVSLGSPISKSLFAESLREQLRVLRQRWPGARLVTMLNKADSADEQAKGLELAGELLTASSQANGGAVPDAVVVASLVEGSFSRVVSAGGWPDAWTARPA